MHSLSFATFLIEEVSGVHPEINAILADSNLSAQQRFNKVKNKIKELGPDANPFGKASAGSSRVFYRIKQKTPIFLDGQVVHVDTGLKIAKQSPLDKFKNASSIMRQTYGHNVPMLGEMQNEAEGNYYLNHKHGIFLPSQHNGLSTVPYEGKRIPVYKTNPEGILPVILDRDEESDMPSWIHFTASDRSPNKQDIRDLTKHPSYPEGFDLEHMVKCLDYHNRFMRGQKTYATREKEQEFGKMVSEHPIMEAMHMHMIEGDLHPSDMNKGNLGVFTHPITGQKFLTIHDAGFTDKVQSAYMEAWKNKAKSIY